MGDEERIQDLLKAIESNAISLIEVINKNEVDKIDGLLKDLRRLERKVYRKVRKEKSIKKNVRDDVYYKLSQVLAILSAEKKDLRNKHLDKLRILSGEEEKISKEIEEELGDRDKIDKLKEQYGSTFPNLIKKIENVRDHDFWKDFVDFAKGHKLIFIQEVHGTKEIPLLVMEIMEVLYSQGFRLFAVEAPVEYMAELEVYKKRSKIEDLQKISLYKAKPKPQLSGKSTLDHMRMVHQAHTLGYEISFFEKGVAEERDIEKYGPEARDYYMTHNFLNVWQKMRQPKAIIFTGISHGMFTPFEDVNGTMRRRLATKTRTKICSVTVVAGGGNWYNFGKEKYEAQEEQMISMLRPDLKRAFFDIRNEPKLMNQMGVEGIIYLKSLSAADLPKVGFLREASYFLKSPLRFLRGLLPI
jgi:hypothetical protein